MTVHAINVLSIITKAVADSRTRDQKPHSSTGPLSRGVYNRISKILSEHLGRFSMELSSEEAALLRRLPNEEAASMFVIYLCDAVKRAEDIVFQERESQAKDALSQECEYLRQQLAAAEEECDEHRQQCLLKTAEAQSFKTAYRALMGDYEMMRRPRRSGGHPVVRIGGACQI